MLLQGAEQIPLGISSPLHQQDILASTPLLNLPGNLLNSTAQEVGCSVVAAARKANIPSEEVMASKLVVIEDVC